MAEPRRWPIDRLLEIISGHLVGAERGALADLRRGLSETTEHRAWPHLANAGCNLNDNRERLIWQTVAAGYATLEVHTKAGNLGATLRQLALGDRAGTRKTEEALKSFAGRFRRLLTCRTGPDVCAHLPGIFRAAKQKRVDIDFRQLYWDLSQWEDAQRQPTVRVDWAAAYWGARGGHGAVP